MAGALQGWKGILAAGSEAAAVGNGDAEVFIGIDRDVVDANFVMEMRPGGASAFPNIADYVAPMHTLSSGNGETRKVPVAGADAVAVVDHDGFAVAAHHVGKGHDAIRRGDDLRAVAAADIDSAVKCAFPVERIDA